jgi:vacuolar-type H+-ATPase subunit I/STV1
MKNITDPKQRTAAIIYAIEKYAYLWSTTITRKFSQTHVKDIDKTNAQFIIKGFGYGYIDRFNSYYTKLEQILQKLDKEINEIDKEIKEIDKETNEIDKEIKEINKEIEWIIGQFTINDVLTKPDVKRLVLKTEVFYIRQKESIPFHLAELIKVAKQ